jgi:hypothetical protein
MNLKTYKNKKGQPIVRKCGNCLFFKKIDDKIDVQGYCKLNQLYFAFTLEKSVYGIVNDFYLCDKHEFLNEKILREQSEEVDLELALLDRNANRKI